MSAAPVNLSREMKLVLVLLGMVALIGGWFLLSGRKNDTAVTQPPVVSGNATSGTNATPNANGNAGAATNTPSTNGTATNVTSDGKVDVAVAPPLPVDDASSNVGANTSTPTPGGINPDQPLISLGSVNPFRPVKLDPVDPNANPGAVQANTNTVPDTAAAGPITISRPQSTNNQIDSALASGSTGGAIPLPSIAGTNKSANTNTDTSANPATATNNSSVGAFPLPTIAGTKTNTGGVQATGSKANTPTTTITVPKGNGAKPGTTGSQTPATGVAANTNTATPEPTPAPAPVVPPVLGMSVPKVNTVPAASAAGAGSSAATPAAQGSSQAATSTTVATPSNPQVVTETAQSSEPVAANAAVAAASPLEAALKEQQIEFNASVLGPVNTAIFRSNNGFVVASVGQVIPDTKVILKEVTATSATISLGNETKTLQLEKR